MTNRLHVHHCLTCFARWECRNRCDLTKLRRVCWKCVREGLERLDQREKERLSDNPPASNPPPLPPRSPA